MSRNLAQYEAVIEYRMHGIPCQIGVISFESISGSYSYNAASDVDYYGSTDAEFDILDRKGYRAKWLEDKGVDYADVVATIAKEYN